MKAVITGIVSAGLLVGFAAPSMADDTRHNKYRKHYGYSNQHSGATQRQMRNLRAYERGEYYETDSNALPVGSRPWFEAKERESGDRR